MKKLIFNHKSYLSLDEIENYKKELDKLNFDGYKLILFPSIIYLSLFKDYKHSVGTQNFFSYNYGSFTGEVNLESLEALKIKYTLIGHSERKKIIEEKYSSIKEKLFKSINSGFHTVLCVGELKRIKNPFSYIKKELNYLLKEMESTNIKYLSIAYEPSWAIGSGEILDISKIELICGKIKKYLNAKYDMNIDVYYGGSVDESHIKEILDVTDGVLIGKASSNIEKVKEIIKSLGL